LLARVEPIGDGGDRLPVAGGAKGLQELTPEPKDVTPTEGGEDTTRSPWCRDVVPSFRIFLVDRAVGFRPRNWSMPGEGTREVADPEAGPAEVITATLALTLPRLPAEGQACEQFAAEHRGGHPDVPGIIPVPPSIAHLPGAVGAQGGEARPLPQTL